MDGTLYDGKGKPVAYIEHEAEAVIYLWSGHVAANFKGELIYGWNGMHLGWFSEGVVYDLNGIRVGSLGEKCPRALQPPRSKGALRTHPPKHERRPEYKRPNFRPSYGEQDFEQFLKAGLANSEGQ
jgi:hypothetical protein